MQRIVPLVAGALAALATDRLVDRLPSRWHSIAPVASLPVLAGIYSVARTGPRDIAPARLEDAAMVAYTVTGIGAAVLAPPQRRLQVGVVAWGAHAAFDVLHPHDEDSRLPSWYAPMCLGYDVALASLLARRLA